MGWFTKKADEVLREQSAVSEALAPPHQQQDYYQQPSSYPSPFSGVTDAIPMGMGMGMQERDISKELAEHLHNNKEQLELLEAKLRGKRIREEYDQRTGEIKRISENFGEPLMNELGIQRYIGYLETMLSKNSIMSNITKNFLGDLMIEENELITSHLLCNQEKYSIKDTDIQQIISLGENFIFLCLTRGVERGESILILKGRRENVTRYVDDAANRALQNSRQSIWSAFGGNNQGRN